MSALTLDRLDRRVLGALSLVDSVTGQPIAQTLSIETLSITTTTDPERWTEVPSEIDLRRNRSGHYVIFKAADLTAHTMAFTAPPAEPGVASRILSLRIWDTTGQYLPRRYDLLLPRLAPTPGETTPGDGGESLPENSLMRPVVIHLYPAPQASVATNWAALRLTLVEARIGTDGETHRFRLPWALIVVTGPDPNTPIVSMRGFADWRGEALIAVSGVPSLIDRPESLDPALAENEPISQREVPVLIQVFVDPALGAAPPDGLPPLPQLRLDTDFTHLAREEGRLLQDYLPHPPAPNANPPPNYVAAAPQSAVLVAGREFAQTLTVSF